jgi:Protein of unknown function (DUF3016)
VIFGLGVGSLSAAEAATVSVQFVNPEKFADFQVQGRDVNYTARAFANSVNEELTPLMKSKYPNGSLVLRFTDIDLVGRYSTAKSVRIVREGHPARMAFDFVLSDSNGKVLAKGSTRLTDNSSLGSNRLDPRRNRVFYHERRVLSRWLRTLSPSR